MLPSLVPYVTRNRFFLPAIVPYVTPTCSLFYPQLFIMLPTVVPYVPRSCFLCYPQSFFMLLTVVLNITRDFSFATLETRRELKPNFVLQLFLESLLGTRQLTIGQFLCPHQTTYLSNLIGMAVRWSLLSLRSSHQK